MKSYRDSDNIGGKRIKANKDVKFWGEIFRGYAEKEIKRIERQQNHILIVGHREIAKQMYKKGKSLKEIKEKLGHFELENIIKWLKEEFPTEKEFIETLGKEAIIKEYIQKFKTQGYSEEDILRVLSNSKKIGIESTEKLKRLISEVYGEDRRIQIEER